jgi:glycosyltransferase involved in cell wall biosynthesis
VAVDMEDWFSEDLLPEARKHRPIRLIRSLERELLSYGTYSSCPSRAMSDAIARGYGCRAPAVVYNAFPWAERCFIDKSHEDRINLGLPSIHWFSQTLGEGRGLEDLFGALGYLRGEVEIHLRGAPTAGFEYMLSSRVPEAWRRRIFIHPQVPNDKLLSRIAEHDIGFAGETPLIRSRDLTVTNKILYYLLAGLAVVASDTAGQREVAAQASGGVSLYPSGDPAALAACLDRLLCSADALRRAKAAALDAAERTFCWERQEKALLDSIARVLRSPGATEQTQSPVPV